MEIIHRQQELATTIADLRATNEADNESIIGFVPTMGGLHEGHLSLIRQSKSECAYTVVSLFLNPTQFNNPKDYETYPLDMQKDLDLLASEGVDVVFQPTKEEMYVTGEEAPKYNLGRVAEVMEGSFRPGHFEGVVWIVSKLFHLVQPDRAYFGLKDFQQIAVIKKMVNLEPAFHSIQIIPCPIVREKSGLALSSRNQRLTPSERATASEIYKALLRGREAKAHGASIAEVKELVYNHIENFALLRIEYFNIVDATTLEEVNNWDESDEIVGAITVYCGEVRLIDHIEFS